MEEALKTDLSGNISDFSAVTKALEAEPGKSIHVRKLYKAAEMEILLIVLDAQAELKVQAISGSIPFCSIFLVNKSIPE